MTKKYAVDRDARAATCFETVEPALNAVSERILNHVFFYRKLREPFSARSTVSSVWAATNSNYFYDAFVEFVK